MREGQAFTGRGAARFVTEAISRARFAGARGPITVRADAGFHSNEFTSACRRAGARFSVTARDQWRSVSGFARILREWEWVPVPDYDDVAETSFVPFYQQRNRIRVRLIVRRVLRTWDCCSTTTTLAGQSSSRTSTAAGRGAALALPQDHHRPRRGPGLPGEGPPPARSSSENAIRNLKYGVGLNHL